MIEIRNLVKRYGNNVAVDHLNFTIENGHIYGFLGPNGAGKSTTMNIITGYLAATEGEVIIDGFNILDEPEKAKSHIGYLPEQPPLYTDMTPREYLNFAAELKGIPAGSRKAEVEKAISRTHIHEVLDKLIANLSKGYRQRVGLALAILGTPDIIILDEPTVGLDPQQIIEVRDLIRELAHEHTVILSSHILSEIQEVCDEILIIHRGKLVASGTASELEEQLGANTFELTLKTGDPEAAKALFADIEGINGISASEGARPGETDISIDLDRNADIREQIFNICVGAGIPILMMRSSEMSLENIFLKLIEDSEYADDTDISSFDAGGQDIVSVTETSETEVEE